MWPPRLKRLVRRGNPNSLRHLFKRPAADGFGLKFSGLQLSFFNRSALPPCRRDAHGKTSGGTYRAAQRESGFSAAAPSADRKSTRLNSSHANISYAVFCLEK